MEQAVEQKFLDVFLTTEHLILVSMILAVLLTIRWIKPISNFLFAEKWKWLIAPVNIVVSCMGVFLLGLTTATTVGMKIAIVFIASAFVTLTYEAVAKYIIGMIETWVRKKLGKDAPVG